MLNSISPQAYSGEQAYDLSESRTLAGSLPICCDGNYGISYNENTMFPGSLGTVVHTDGKQLFPLSLAFIYAFKNVCITVPSVCI